MANSKAKVIKQSAKRVNKAKPTILSEQEHAQRVAHMKDIVRATFPVIADLDSIYDAQTVANALSGFILAHIAKKMGDIKLSEIEIDLSKEEPSKIKTAITTLIENFKDEPAKHLSETMERLGKTFAEYGATTFMKQPMATIKVTDLLA